MTPVCGNFLFFFHLVGVECVLPVCISPLRGSYDGYFGHESYKVIAYCLVKFFAFNRAYIRKFYKLLKGQFRSCHC